MIYINVYLHCVAWNACRSMWGILWHSRECSTRYSALPPSSSLHFTSLVLTSLYLSSLHFTSLHFTSLHLSSLHVTSRHLSCLQVGKLAVLAFPLSPPLAPSSAPAAPFSNTPCTDEALSSASVGTGEGSSSHICKIGYLAFNFKGVAERF
jgi:hypothetical protein